MFRDKEAISSKRPEKFVEHEKEEYRRNSSVVPGDIAAAQEARRQSIIEKDRLASGKEHLDDV